MLEEILRLYTTAMHGEVRSPTPHLFGPPGCGKSYYVEQAADLLGVNLHVINVSRISPLELEGVQMPDVEHKELNLLTAIFWTRMKDGDILLLDEFLRGFPEVYNGLLDIMTSRTVAGFKLPKVFIIAASNTTVAYDKALEDRLLHIPVPDPRKDKHERKHVAQIIVKELGLLPEMATAWEMDQVVEQEVLPTYEILDTLTNRAALSGSGVKGRSVRNLIGQVQLRHVVVDTLKEMINMNNIRALQQRKAQFVVLLNGKNVDEKYTAVLDALIKSPKLTPVQRLNATLNQQLIELENARKEGVTEDEAD